jgi:GNAT superfamily N-acetyltransferase
MDGVSAVAFRSLQRSDLVPAFATLVSAFANDPVERWLYPELEHYESKFPDFVEAFGGKAFAAQTAWAIADLSAVALWLPPGTEPDGEHVVAVLLDHVEAAKHDEILTVLEQMGAVHPTSPHWYLPWFGVNAAVQGSGLGSQLMAHCLAIVDVDHLPVYLETTNPRTLPFYERHGFEVVGMTHAPTCPPLTFMLRAAR